MIAFAADKPRYNKAIDEHPKTRGPESFFERHYNPATTGQLVKDTVRFCCALDVQRHGEASWFLIAIRRDIATHDHLIADRHAAVHDFAVPAGRNFIRQWSSTVME